ncbi:SAM-dependent methyltransferase, MidA [hydrothermal vent metagenome]|uniref:SAM-dependent methyltransferase, MidA n=1 Tax=hydrothermal vent metagenome TaxID=652676 RepID=A0A3B0Z0W8_9ZZZZ
MNRNRSNSEAGQLRIGELDEQTITHSAQLAELIIDEIKQQGDKIPFIRYMELILHAPGLGYYSAGAHKIGAAGDFITAPEISPLFSQCVARQCQQVLHDIGGGDVLEVGAGSGAMACEVLRELEKLDCLPEHYFILDLSADLRERQRVYLQQELPHLMGRIAWLNALPETGFKGVVLANELLDAMPVHLVRFDPENLTERYVSWSGERFSWCDGPLSESRLSDVAAHIIEECGADEFDHEYVSEINLAAADWVRSVAAILEQGLVLLIDYGFPRREYYIPERKEGTVMCHYRHQAHSDPLILPGLQDVTAHVDFTAIAESAADAGMDVAGYASQAHFLLGAGLMDVLAENAETSTHEQQVMQAQAVKTLTMPQEMGELFKVIALTKKMEPGLVGFSMLDARGRL